MTMLVASPKGNDFASTNTAAMKEARQSTSITVLPKPGEESKETYLDETCRLLSPTKTATPSNPEVTSDNPRKRPRACPYESYQHATPPPLLPPYSISSMDVSQRLQSSATVSLTLTRSIWGHTVQYVPLWEKSSPAKTTTRAMTTSSFSTEETKMEEGQQQDEVQLSPLPHLLHGRMDPLRWQVFFSQLQSHSDRKAQYHRMATISFLTWITLIAFLPLSDFFLPGMIPLYLPACWVMILPLLSCFATMKTFSLQSQMQDLCQEESHFHVTFEWVSCRRGADYDPEENDDSSQLPLYNTSQPHHHASSYVVIIIHHTPMEPIQPRLHLPCIVEEEGGTVDPSTVSCPTAPSSTLTLETTESTSESMENDGTLVWQ